MGSEASHRSSDLRISLQSISIARYYLCTSSTGTMVRYAFLASVAILGLLAPSALGQGTTEQLTSPRLSERAQRALFPVAAEPFKITANTVGQINAASAVNNAAGFQLQADKTPFPILSTLPNGGSSFFLTALKPCGIILPHVHMRATEQYIMITGTMTAGIAEENGGRQNVTFTVGPGQSFLVPQGLLHYNTNKGCTPIVFVQMFNSADGGTINVINSLAALRGVDNATISSSGAGGVTASPQGAFGLDQACLASCGLSSSGGDFSRLSGEMSAFLGLAGTPATAPAGSLPTLSSSG